MNELTIYTKCLIKSAAAPGINIAGRLGMLAAEDEGLYSERRTRRMYASRVRLTQPSCKHQRPVPANARSTCTKMHHMAGMKALGSAIKDSDNNYGC